MTTFICGYWKIKDNVKHSYNNHYKKLIPKTFNILKNCNIVFFYDDDDILSYIKKHIQTKNIIYKKISIDSLETYDLSNDYLETCKLQDNVSLRKINTMKEKGLIHYQREYKKSGEDSFRKVFTVWTSKLFLINKTIDENPFNTNYFAWIDVSASRFNRDSGLYTQFYLPNKLFYFENSMKYYGKTITINASFLIAHKNIWKKLMPLYEKQLELSKNSKYAHDEETILYLIWKDNKDLFCDIKKYKADNLNISLTNFESAKKFVDMKIKHNNESLSGPGSHINNTTETINLINETIKKYNIKTILDLGCGDWNWFRLIDIEGVSYTGWDSHKGMINLNTKKYGKANIHFKVKDIILDEYPKTDLIICRDVLFHLDISFAKKCINKVKNSCKYFISTSFNDIKENTNIKKYCEIKGWGFYRINLNIYPFDLKKYMIESINEKKNSKNDSKRFINLYIFN